MKVIGLVGKARSGKSTAASYIEKQYGFVQYAMANPLKSMLLAGFGLDPRDYETTEAKEAVIPWIGKSYRHLAQTLGTEWARSMIDRDIWLTVAERRISALMRMGFKGMVITDVRFENEATMVRELLGGKVFHILRNHESGLSDSAKSHVSEAGVSAELNDALIFNHGTIEELHRNIDIAMEGV